jgi:hypothetical protein
MSTNVTVTRVPAPLPVAGAPRLRAGAPGNPGAALDQDLGPIPGNIDAAVKQLQKALSGMVMTQFATRFGHASQNDAMTGIMGPWTPDQGGTAPKCAIDQITLDFEDWGIDTDPGTISRMVMTITRHLANTSGEIGTLAGSTPLPGTKQIEWCVGWGLADVGQSMPPEQGVIYAYTAAEGSPHRPLTPPPPARDRPR